MIYDNTYSTMWDPQFQFCESFFSKADEHSFMNIVCGIIFGYK